MKAAILVPSIGIDALVLRCTEACRRLCPDAELVLLVDDATGRERLVEGVRVVETGPISIGAKRNLGAELTTGDVLAFIDSDAYPSEGWLANAVSFLGDHPEFDAVGGPNVSPPDEPASRRYVGAANLSFLVGGWWAFRRDPHAHEREVQALPSCNLVVRRHAYDAIGGMNAELFTAEDTDFCYRFVASGRRIWFTPDVLVYHRNRDLSSMVIQRFTYGVAMVPLLRRGRRPSTAYTLVSFAVVAFVLVLLSAPLALWFPIWGWLWGGVVGLYLLVVIVEAVRHASRPADIAGTGLALVIGNLAPGVGFGLKTVRAVPNLRGIYRNDR